MQINLNNIQKVVDSNQKECSAVYFNGNKCVWHESDYYNQYFTTESLEDNNTITLSVGSSIGPESIVTISTSYDKVNWNTTTIVKDTAQTISVTLNTGEKAYWKGSGVSLANGYSTVANWSIFSATGNYNVYGNIASFFYGDSFVGKYKMPDTPNYGRNFQRMFYQDTHVVDAGNLIIPFYNCQNNACAGMFQGCTSMTHAPELWYTSVGTYGCQNMFHSCGELLTATHQLLATRLTPSCYNNMFYQCAKLTNAPKMRVTNISEATTCCTSMFYQCANIPSIDILLDSTTVASNCYQDMFCGCTSLTSIGNLTLPATTLAANCYREMFFGCSNISDWGNLTLPATTMANQCYQLMFRDCTKMNVSPAMTIDTAAIGCCNQMFRGCAALEDVSGIKLNALTLYDSCYTLMFAGCKITTAPELPATTLAANCYTEMFSNCSSMTTGPSELPATTLVDSCYKMMFRNTKLTYIKCLATDMSASNCLSNWVALISSSGTFTKAAGVTWPSGASGIPTGWTVIEV